MGSIPEPFSVSGDMEEWLHQQVCEEGSFYAGTGRYRMAYAEECGLEDDDDPGVLVIRREKDGSLWEVEISVHAHPYTPPEPPPEPRTPGGLMQPITQEEVQALRQHVADMRENRPL